MTQCGLEDESSQTSHRWESSKACRQNPWGFSSQTHTPCVTTRQPTQILPTGKQNNACGWNAVDGVPKKVWIRQIATQPKGIKFLFSAKPNQTEQIARTMCYIFTFLGQIKKKKKSVCVKTPQICLCSFCLFLLNTSWHVWFNCMFFGCLQIVKRGTGRWAQGFYELSHLTHLIHYFSWSWHNFIQRVKNLPSLSKS